MFSYNFIDLNFINPTVTFLELSISTCPGNSACKKQVMDSGSGLFNLASMRKFSCRVDVYDLRLPLCLLLGRCLLCRNPWLTFLRWSCKHWNRDEYTFLKIVFLSPGRREGWRAIHTEWHGIVLNSVYTQQEICRIIKMKVEWICNWRNN